MLVRARACVNVTVWQTALPRSCARVEITTVTKQKQLLQYRPGYSVE